MTREEAIKIVRNIYQTDAEKEALATLIPELAESEDERILRVISEAVITFFSDYANDFEDEDRDAALAWLEKQKEQKPAWSEEDDEMLEYVIGDLNDAKQLFHAKDAIDLCDKEIAWLKSLRPQSKRDCKDCAMFLNGECIKPHWKPSEEQMKALETAIVRCQMTGLESLYEELKKLM